MITSLTRTDRAFTLIETVITIGLLGLIAGLLLSAVQSTRAAATRTQCSNNLHQIGLAVLNFESVSGTLPPAYWAPDGASASRMNWPVTLLPYIDQDALWQTTVAARQISTDDRQDPPHVGLSTVVRVYTCPADIRLTKSIKDKFGNTAAYGSYEGVAGGKSGDGAMRPYEGVRLAEITDGSSNTLLIGERPPLGRLLIGNWYTMTVAPELINVAGATSGINCIPVYVSGGRGQCNGPFRFGPGKIDNPCDIHHFWSLHSGGAFFLFSDGAVRFMPYSAEPRMLALATRAGGEVVMPDAQE